MHPLYPKADELSRVAIGAAIEVHRLKGPGLIESIYERCLMRELELRQIALINQRLVRIEYKGLVFEEPVLTCAGVPEPKMKSCEGAGRKIDGSGRFEGSVIPVYLAAWIP